VSVGRQCCYGWVVAGGVSVGFVGVELWTSNVGVC